MIENQNNTSWSAKSEDKNSLSTGLRRTKILCVQTRNLKSQNHKILLSAVDLSIYISKPSSKAGAKEPHEMQAEELVSRCCWEGTPSPWGLCRECHSHCDKPRAEEEESSRSPTDK